MPAPSAASREEELRRGLTAFQSADYTTAVRAWQQAKRTRATPGVDRALAEALFRRALSAIDLARRAQDLQEAVALAPDRAVYHFHLGLACLRQGQLRRALVVCEEAHRLAPDDDRIRCQLALVLLADPASTARARDLLAASPTSDETAVRLRVLADLRGNAPSAAIATLAAGRSPSPLAVLALGFAHLMAGQATEALASLATVRRSRRPSSDDVRPAAALAIVAARLSAGDLDGALTTLRGQDVPGDARLRGFFATVCRRLATELLLDERADEALFAWQQAWAAEPSHDVTSQCLAHVNELAGTRASRRGDFAAAVKHWEAALDYQPANDRLLRNLALADEHLERWHSASVRWEELIRRWKKALPAGRADEVAERRARLGAAYRHLAQIYESAGDSHAAVTALDRALHLDPSDLDLRLRLAGLYLENESYGNAIEHLRRALTARPDDTRILLDLGSAFDLKGDDRQAQSYLEQALAREPENPGIKATLASVCHGRAHRLSDSGLGDRAVAEFQRAMELAPGDPEHARCLASLHLKRGHVDAAATIFDQALALKPKDPVLRVAIGRKYLDHGYVEKAELLFRQALRIQRSDLTQALIGDVYIHHGDLAKAAPYVKRVLKGSNAELLVLIGHAYLDAGVPVEAIPYLARAVSLNSFDLDARLTLALAYALGHRDHARAAEEIAQAEKIARLTGDPRDMKVIAIAREANERMAEVAAFASERRGSGG